MKSIRLLTPALAVTLTTFAGAAAAQINVQSDLFLVSLPGAVTCTVTLPEGAAAGTSETAVCFLPPFADGLLPGVLPLTVAPVVGAVALLEPVGELPDPSVPPVLWGNRLLSDLVIAFSIPNNPLAPFGFAMISDGDANLAPWASFLATLPVPVFALDETGAVQDLSSFLPTPFHVAVVSDVPEPASAVLWLAGLAGLGGLARRRTPGSAAA